MKNINPELEQLYDSYEESYGTCFLFI